MTTAADSEAEVRAVLGRIEAAWKEKRFDGLDECFDEEAVIVGPNYVVAINRSGGHNARRPAVAWDAIRDVGALHTRLVPGFVVMTELVPGGRRVTFGNGLVVEEPIIDMNDDNRRLVWTAVRGTVALTHYNAASRCFHERQAGAAWCGLPTCFPRKQRVQCGR
jgi:hypothetical protein